MPGNYQERGPTEGEEEHATDLITHDHPCALILLSDIPYIMNFFSFPFLFYTNLL